MGSMEIIQVWWTFDIFWFLLFCFIRIKNSEPYSVDFWVIFAVLLEETPEKPAEEVRWQVESNDFKFVPDPKPRISQSKVRLLGLQAEFWPFLAADKTCVCKGEVWKLLSKITVPCSTAGRHFLSIESTPSWKEPLQKTEKIFLF